MQATLVSKFKVILRVISGIGLKDPNTRWPQNIVPYDIDIEKYKESDIERIRESMKKIESKTCIRFVEHTDEQNYIKIHVT